MAFRGNHLLVASSVLQSTVSLSSGESEYYAMVLGSARGLGLQSLMAVQASVTVCTDSAAA
eukprot:10093010-Prorocentrum_lima.AAC.1